MIGSLFVKYTGNWDYVESVSTGKGVSYKAEKVVGNLPNIGIELDFVRVRKELTLNFQIKASDLNNDLGWVPAQVFTIGASFPETPGLNDIHTYTGTTNETYKTNTMYRWTGTAWDVLGQAGTYIDPTGIYTGTVAATQITTGYLNAARIEAGTITFSKLAADAVRVATKGTTFPITAKQYDTHYLTADVGSPVTHKKDILYVYDGTTPYSINGWDIIGAKGTYIDDTGVYTGTVNATQVNAGTLTGFVVQTAASGARIMFDGPNNKLTFVDSSGNESSLYTTADTSRIYCDKSIEVALSIWGNDIISANYTWIGASVSTGVRLSCSGGFSYLTFPSGVGSSPSPVVLATVADLSSYSLTTHNHDSAYAALSHTHTFASLTSKPTTLSGYGITDAATSTHDHTFASLTSKPTTLSGYGITDAATSTHNHDAAYAALSHSHTSADITDGYDGSFEFMDELSSSLKHLTFTNGILTSVT